MPPTQTLPSLQAAFAKHLFIHGYPLWTPEPDLLPSDCQSVGLRIGDVGTVDERGRFDLFFNIFESPPRNCAPPPNFPPIEEDNVRCDSEDIPPREVTSSPTTLWDVEELEAVDVAGVTRRTTEYGATLSDDGSHIILPQGAQMFEIGLHHRRLFEDYAREHGADWVKRFRDRLGWPRSNSIYLLTGYHKTCSWSIASFSMQMAANADPVRTHCKLVEVDERTIREASVWQPTGRFQRKIGPPPDRQGRYNQTVFIRAITVTPNVSEESKQREAGLLGRIISYTQSLASLVGDSNRETTTETPTSDVKIEHIPNITQAFHPSEIINHYLLTKEPSAKIAVTHDRQWIAMLKSSEGGQSWTLEDLQNELEELVQVHYSIGTHKDTVYLRENEYESPIDSDVDQSRLSSDLADTTLDWSTNNPTITSRSSLPTRSFSLDRLLPPKSRMLQNVKHLGRTFVQENPLTSPPSRSIVDAFTEYINNEIPTRFIDTSRLRFVSREDVLRIFKDEIAKVTEEQIQERMRISQSDPLASYQPKRETVLKQIIQEIVKYDILSHHRDEIAGEPTHRDIGTGRRYFRITFGSSKVVRFCETSRMLGRKLAWVDTCCIDQTNAAEPSEAAQATYKWYANSYLCIVYHADSTSYEDWVRERWFTQGWTLQELLAPIRIKFYNKYWQPFNPLWTDDDRQHDDVARRLWNVTSICKKVLTADNSHGVQGCTFWEIVSWASRRQTTRIEDKAYCLAGLLNVGLTINYGEGQRAFSRLVGTIVAKNPRWDVLAWFGQPSTDHFALPLSPASYPEFEAHWVEGRGGVQEFKITPNELSLRSLPPIPMELRSVVDPDGPGNPFRVSLKPRSDQEGFLGRYGNLLVECGASRLELIRDARQLSACIINHHTAENCEQGKLVVGAYYICFLLYSENGEDDETSWMKVSTDNLLRISCVGIPGTSDSNMVLRESDFVDTESASMVGQESFTLPLETISIRSPTSK